MIIGGVVSLIIIIVIAKKVMGGGRSIGYWKYPDSSRVYYSDKAGVIAFGDSSKYNLHRQANNLPQDFTSVDTVDVMYEENNEYYSPSDSIVLI